MKDGRMDEELEKSLKGLFDETTRTADDAALDRMLAAALEIPGRRRSLWQRLLAAWPRAGWIALPVAAVTALVLALGLPSHPEDGGTRGTPVAMLSTSASRSATNPGAGETGAVQGTDTEVAVVPADPLAALDTDIDPIEDDMALLDPPHMAFDNVDDSVWLAVYDEVLDGKISL